jgi:hypothetical protein
MRTFKRTYLPDEIESQGKKYLLDLDKTNLKRDGHSFITKECILVHVLSKNLKGRTDLHGMPYKPTEWVFQAVN